MNKQEPQTWLDIHEAAALVGKSVSTIRRLVSSMPEEEAAEHICREPLKDKGGDKILISRAYLVERYEVQESAHGAGTDAAGAEPPGGENRASMVHMLERQLEAKDRQIDSISRQLEQEQQTLGDIAESLRQAVAVNTALNNKLLLLTEKAGEYTAGPGADTKTKFPWYFVAVAVGLSLIGVLLLYLLLF